MKIILQCGGKGDDIEIQNKQQPRPFKVGTNSFASLESISIIQDNTVTKRKLCSIYFVAKFHITIESQIVRVERHLRQHPSLIPLLYKEGNNVQGYTGSRQSQDKRAAQLVQCFFHMDALTLMPLSGRKRDSASHLIIHCVHVFDISLFASLH